MYKIILALGALALVQAAPKHNADYKLNSMSDGNVDKPVVTTTPAAANFTTASVATTELQSSNISCQTPEGQDGLCTVYFHCREEDYGTTEDPDLFHIKNIYEQVCPSYLELCCLKPQGGSTEPSVTLTSSTLPQREGCGWRNPDGLDAPGSDVKDHEAKFGEFPWMVAMFEVKPIFDNKNGSSSLNVYIGGGSLIHPSAVLTTAHNAAGKKAIKVRAGEWNVRTASELYPYQDRDVSSVVIHKDYSEGNQFYDIALLFLSRPMDLKPNVGVACLPPPRELVPDGTQCIASGWGKDKFGKEGRFQTILKKIELSVMARQKCTAALRKTRLGPYFELHSSFMCAGGKAGKDPCTGDGGSPLVCPIETEPDRYMQSGIVSWGIGCGDEGNPGVYVDVSNLRSWIDDKIAGKGLDPKVYSY